MNKSQIIAASISAGTSVFTGVYALHQANVARKNREGLESDLNTLEENRQQIVNPYANVANQYANLGVATQAAEFQAEQADIALANTLDAVRQTGAGGATALAQAALQSKKDIAANLESQEKANDDKRVEGEKQLQNQLVSEEQRMQGLDAAGKSFVYNETERREQQQLDRVSNQIAALRGQESQARADSTGAITGALGAVAGIAGAGGFGKQ